MQAFPLVREHVMQLAEERAGSFQSASPFPHIIIDDFLPEQLIGRLIADFPSPESEVWYRYNSARQVKLALEDEERVPDVHRSVLRELNGQAFVSFLEKLTGIEGLVPDPHLRGGGLHQISPGGLLKVHADFNIHPRLQLARRLNALLYLNKDWQDSYGGALELWDPEMKHAVQKVWPRANRLVVFATTDTSFHGHPDALQCPEGMTRKSMAWYYYTAVPQAAAPDPRTTLFKERPGEQFSSRTRKAVNRGRALAGKLRRH